MRRYFFKAVEPQKTVTKAFMIFGGTEKERIEKMRNLTSEYINTPNARGLCMQVTIHLIEKGMSYALLLIKPKDQETKYNSLDYIEQLAKEQGNIIDITPAHSLQYGKYNIYFVFTMRIH